MGRLLVDAIQAPFKGINQTCCGSFWLFRVLGQWNVSPLWVTSRTMFLQVVVPPHLIQLQSWSLTVSLLPILRHLEVKPAAHDVDVSQQIIRGPFDRRVILPSSSGLLHFIIFRASVRHHSCFFRSLSQIVQVCAGGRWRWPCVMFSNFSRINISKCLILHVMKPFNFFTTPCTWISLNKPIEFLPFRICPSHLLVFGRRSRRGHCSTRCCRRRHQTFPFSTWKGFKPIFTSYT